MGGFCVFGISRSVCKRLAEKVTPTEVGETEGLRCLSIEEWGGRVRAAADLMFATTRKRVRISPEFDAPHFCRDWIAVAPTEVAHTKIMCRGEKTDKNGKVIVRRGMPVMTWVEYDPRRHQIVPASRSAAARPRSAG